MGTRIEVGQLSSLKAIEDIMASQSLPKLPRNALMAIGKTEGETFKKALANIANNEDAMNHDRVYVQKVTCLLSPTVQEILVSMNYVLPLETLLKLGKECGREFRSNLSSAAAGDGAARDWIQRKVTEHGAVSNNQGLDGNSKATPTSHPNSVSNVRPINQGRATENKPGPRNEHSHTKNSYSQKNQNNEAEEAGSDREFFSMTFYGTKSALCFNAVSKDGNHSINVDGGNKKPNQKEGGREIDWADKVIFGFSADEMIELAWVLLGLSQSCEFTGHGPLHDKSFQFKRQNTGYFASVSAKDKGSRAIPMSNAAGLRLMLMVSRQLKKNFPDMTVNEILVLLKTMAKPGTQGSLPAQQKATA